jgi:hypothetical protein
MRFAIGMPLSSVYQTRFRVRLASEKAVPNIVAGINPASAVARAVT